MEKHALSRDDTTWVYIEVIKGGQVSSYRGRMDGTVVRDLLAGTCNQPFVRLDDVHWFEATWDPVVDRNAFRLIAFGRDSQYVGFEGSLNIRPEFIYAIAPLKNCEETLKSHIRTLDDE
jgi:hypothetical protein